MSAPREPASVRRNRRRVVVRGGAAALLVLGVGMVAVGTGLVGTDAGAGPTATATRAPSTGTPVEPVAATRLESRAAPRAQAAAPPTRVTVPALGLRAEVLPIEVSPDGVLDPPGDVSAVGWWQRSAEAGARSGQIVMTGHSVHDGGGVMDDLEQLRRGDTVVLRHDAARSRYRVRSVEVWSKAQVAEKAEDIFAQDRRRGRLVLITCEDWNGTSWDSNVVVFATPLRAAR